MSKARVSKSKTFSSNAFYYMCIPINFAFYFFVSPVYVKLGTKNVLVLKTSYVHKIGCGLIHGISLLVGICVITNALDGQKSLKENPIKLYDITTHGLNFFYSVLWVWVCWDRKNGLEALIRTCYAQVPFGLLSFKLSRLKRSVFYVLCFVNTFGLLLFHVIKDWEYGLVFTRYSSWQDLMSQVAKLSYTMDTDKLETGFQHGKMSAVTMSLSLGCALFDWAPWMTINCVGNTLCIISYTVYTISKEYSDLLKRKSLITFEEIKDSYEEVSNFIECFNRVFSGIFFVHILLSIPYFGLYTTDIVDSTNIRLKLTMIEYTICIAIFFIYAALANETFESLVDYIFENQERLVREGTRETELVLFLTKLRRSVNGMGLKGSKFLTISFRFLGTFAGTLTTFQVIALQFPQSSKRVDI